MGAETVMENSGPRKDLYDIIIYGTKIAVFVEIYLEDPLNITKLDASELSTF